MAHVNSVSPPQRPSETLLCRSPRACSTISGWWLSPTPLKNMKVNGKDDIPYMKWKIKFHGSKPPTRYLQIASGLST